MLSYNVCLGHRESRLIDLVALIHSWISKRAYILDCGDGSLCHGRRAPSRISVTLWLQICVCLNLNCFKLSVANLFYIKKSDSVFGNRLLWSGLCHFWGAIGQAESYQPSANNYFGVVQLSQTVKSDSSDNSQSVPRNFSCFLKKKVFQECHHWLMHSSLWSWLDRRKERLLYHAAYETHNTASVMQNIVSRETASLTSADQFPLIPPHSRPLCLDLFMPHATVCLHFWLMSSLNILALLCQRRWMRWSEKGGDSFHSWTFT